MVNKSILDRTLEYIAKHPDGKFDLWGFARVYLVSAKDGGPNDEYEPYTLIGISSLIPRAWTLLDGPGWPSIYDQINL
jgi:hypothetical protein